jgi:signal transduction histidine kinase
MGAGLVGLCVGLVLLGLSRISTSRVVRPLLCFVLTVVFWAFGEFVASGADDMAEKRIGLGFLYSGAIFLPVCWWTLAVRWAQEVEGRERLRSRLWLRAPLLWAGAMALVAASNPWHGEFLTPVLGGRNEYGPLWWVMAVPNYALITAAAALVIQVLRRVERPAVRWQGIVLISSSGLTLFSHFVFLLGSEVRPGTTLLVFATAGAILALGMYREGLFGVLPAALPVIFEHDPDGLLVVRPGGRLVRCNPRARELLAPALLGVDAQIPVDLPGLVSAADGLPTDASATDPRILWWSEVLSSGGGVYRYGPDAARFLHLSGQAVRGRGDRLVALVLRVRDVTAEEEANTALRRARRLESVAELAQGVAHDFHNMLGVMRGNAQLAAQDLRGQPEVEQRLERILRFGEKATDLADQLQLYAGGADPIATSLDLNEIVRDTAEGLEPESGAQVALQLDLCCAKLQTFGDATQLRQAVLNLIMNAREVLQDRGGVIRVSTGRASVDPAAYRGLVLGGERRPGLYAFVRVADDGPGIDRDAQERIFEPFVSSKGKHRGIGLSTVLGIARAHHALLQLESAPGRGASFGIYLDLTG